MPRNMLAGATALALVIAFAAGASANPQNRFGDNNTAAAIAMSDANASSGAVEPSGVAGIAGAAGAGGKSTAYAESFNSDIEVISVQQMTATVNGAPLVVFGGIGGTGIGGVLSSGATTVTVAAGAGTFGGIANINVASGYFNSALGGVSAAGTGLFSRDGAQ